MTVVRSGNGPSLYLVIDRHFYCQLWDVWRATEDINVEMYSI